METMSMDFAFVKNSLLHGRFLVECREFNPDIEITEVTRFYLSIMAAGSAVLNVCAPDELAVVLKLRFGQCMKHRPLLKPPIKDMDYKKFYKESLFDTKIKKNNDYGSSFDKDWFKEDKLIDEEYFTSLKDIIKKLPR
jgi:hypothetical protein